MFKSSRQIVAEALKGTIRVYKRQDERIILIRGKIPYEVLTVAMKSKKVYVTTTRYSTYIVLIDVSKKNI